MLMKKWGFLLFIIFFISCEKPMSMDDVKDYYEDIIVNFPNEHLNLHWSEKFNGMTWDEATEYCEDLDGRLPTISELRTLIQNCPATETGGVCEVTNDCLSRSGCLSEFCFGCSDASDGSYSKFGDIGWFWSSSEQSDYTAFAWGVRFDDGGVGFSSKGSNESIGYVRCVR